MFDDMDRLWVFLDPRNEAGLNHMLSQASGRRKVRVMVSLVIVSIVFFVFFVGFTFWMAHLFYDLAPWHGYVFVGTIIVLLALSLARYYRRTRRHG